MHYVIGDIHGQIYALKRLLSKLDLQPEDKVYFVGDWFDRSYTTEDTAETIKWMLEHLTKHSQFHTVVGNHDLDQLELIKNTLYLEREGFEGFGFYDDLPEKKYIKQCYPKLEKLIESMPLYEEFTIENQKFLVTHSWLMDNNNNAIGEEGFDIEDLNIQYSIWNRSHSVFDYETEQEIPIIVHGHTPTIGRHDIFKDGCHALARIQKVNSHNINVDCCAFFSPLRGGNLAAYRCEDGAEFYAYEDDVFYTLVDKYCKQCSNGIAWYAWYFSILFYRRHTEIFYQKDVDKLVFQNERAKQAFDSMKQFFFADKSIPSEKTPEAEQAMHGMEIGNIMKGILNKIHMIAPTYWVEVRDLLDSK